MFFQDFFSLKAKLDLVRLSIFYIVPSFHLWHFLVYVIYVPWSSIDSILRDNACWISAFLLRSLSFTTLFCLVKLLILKVKTTVKRFLSILSILISMLTIKYLSKGVTFLVKMQKKMIVKTAWSKLLIAVARNGMSFLRYLREVSRDLLSLFCSQK